MRRTALLLAAALTIFFAGWYAGATIGSRPASATQDPLASAEPSPTSTLYSEMEVPSPPAAPATSDATASAEPETHGVDKPPPGVSLGRRPSIDELRQRRLLQRKGGYTTQAAEGSTPSGETSTTASYELACIGDGVSGKRVLALYARAVDIPDRSADVIPLIRQYAADVDYRINRSAGQSGEGRRVRFVTSPTATGCELDVRTVVLTPTGDDSFANTRSELIAQGFNLTDRKYLVWVDAAVGICGLGQFYRDTTPGPTNKNNGGPMFARVDAPCWGYAETHELLHTLGAVQSTAKNATVGGHCTDENDAMCYADADGVTLRIACPDAPAQQVDCGLDDYFNAAPPAGSYLDQNWNLADSAFLEGTSPPPVSPTVAVTAPTSMLAGNTVTVSAKVSVPEGRGYQVNWSTTRGECRFAKPSSLSTSFSCPVTVAGDGRITATVIDSLGLAGSTTATFSFTVPSTPRDTTLSSAVSSRLITYGSAVTVSGRFVDAATGRGVMGMPVAVYSLPKGTTTWRQVATVSTDINGYVKTQLRPPRTTTYQLVSGRTSTWQSANSANRVAQVAPRLTAAVADSTIRVGQEARVSVRLTPAHIGQRVQLQRLVSGVYGQVATATLSSTGTAVLRYRPPTAGTYTLRVRKLYDTDHATVVSPRYTVSVSR